MDKCELGKSTALLSSKLSQWIEKGSINNFKVGWQDILHMHLNSSNKQNNFSIKIQGRQNYQLFLTHQAPVLSSYRYLKRKCSKIPPPEAWGVGTENPSFGINNLLFLTPLPHSTPWSSQSGCSPGGGECASLVLRDVQGRNEWRWKRTQSLARIWGDYPKGKRGLSTQGCPRE